MEETVIRMTLTKAVVENADALLIKAGLSLNTQRFIRDDRSPGFALRRTDTERGASFGKDASMARCGA